MQHDMRKIIDVNSWGFSEPQITELPITHTHNKIVGHDKKAMMKYADESLLSKLASLQFAPGEVGVHINAIGATERYSCNRNGDGFRENVCRQYHPTFVKYAKFYRGHKADDPNQSYGIVKLSHYNEAMKRIELIAALNSTQAAADLNKGHIADKELAKLANNEDVPTSMGCLCAYDQCTACGNKAKTRRLYCDEHMCKAGGLKKNIGKIVELDGDLHHLHADTYEPYFNDISHVPHQADRISYVTGILRKAASVESGRIICGAELADMIYEDPYDNQWKKIARQLSETETTIETYRRITPALCKQSRDQNFHCPVVDGNNLGQVTTALAEQGIILPINEFAQLFTGAPVNSLQLKQATVGLFDHIVVPPDNPYAYNGSVPTKYKAWAASLMNDFGLTDKAIQRRMQKAAVLNISPVTMLLTKTASTNALIDEVAQQYGLYVLASLEKISQMKSQNALTTSACLLQNLI